MSQRALITGISGFVGGFLAEHLLAQGDSVLGLAPDERWTASSPPALAQQVELLAWDLGLSQEAPEQTRRAIERFAPSAVYHLAALSVPRHCGEDQPTDQAVALNVGGTRCVLQLAASLPSRPRVLVISSAHVYGQVSRESYRVNEEAPLAPRTAYGRTKLAAEEEVRRAVEDGCDALIARAFPHSGPRQVAPLMLADWMRQFTRENSEPVQVHTCDAHLDFCDVRDVVGAYRLLVERGERGEAYNVGSGVNRRSGDIFEQLRRMADPGRALVELHPGFKQEPIADVSRVTRVTGWKAAIPLEQTLADTLAWWRGRKGLGIRD